MLDDLLDRVAKYTVPGAPDQCWQWAASCLPNGRPRLGVKYEGRSTSITVARIIAAARDEIELDANPRWVARHSCDNVACVNPAHILSGTYKQNSDDMWERGRGARGDRRPSARLSIETVRVIRARLAGGESQSSIGRDIGVSQSHISQVARRVIWGWVE